MECSLPDALILRTKFYIPPPPATLIERPQLLARLSRALETRLTLVSAQAGFGKTTLLSAWLAQAAVRAAWLALDESDNDETRFASLLISALQTLDSSLGVNAQALLSGSACNTWSLQDVLASIINDLLHIKDGPPFVLALDDYHLIANPAIHQGITFFIDRLPDHAHLILASRTDPPLPLARWRVRNQLTEIRTQELCLTESQAAEFLNQTMGLALSTKEVAALRARTEGWIAGLQLAALSLREQPDRARWLTAFTGSEHLILGYLVEEILDRQPDEIRHFLLQTSILDRMTAALCNAVTGRQDAQSILARLDRDNLFIAPVDASRCCYRYHQLWREALGYRLQQTDGVQVVELHRRAAEWYERNGLAAEAAAHRLAAGAPPISQSAVGQQTLLEPLSERELQILELIAEGQSNREIGELLALTTGTVKWYMTRILGKLGAANRTEAVARARDAKLLP